MVFKDVQEHQMILMALASNTNCKHQLPRSSVLNDINRTNSSSTCHCGFQPHQIVLDAIERA